MEEQIRNLSARYGWKLSEDEIRRIAAEARVQEQVLARLNEVDLGQTRPVMGVFKVRRGAAKGRRK